MSAWAFAPQPAGEGDTRFMGGLECLPKVSRGVTHL